MVVPPGYAFLDFEDPRDACDAIRDLDGNIYVRILIRFSRIAFSGSTVGRDDHFYRSTNLIYLNDWLDEVNVVRAFRLNCYRLGNPMPST
ncbi:hypothetical protein Bca52824_032526 [Brassica carinata]|uniref:RRM domain-containing protein n=1 Tax=Brassica carinata TaxID=52824 RepID=A0A8X7SC75_BRACI|nr:hypothetical protein Bca52824_032526 [Brassica carinata]